jgi:4-nitrophenyl phosphatase
VAQYVQKLARFGVRILPEQVLTSPVATAGFLRQRYPEGTKVYAVGEAGLHQALSAAGFEVIGPAEVRGGDGAPVVVGGLTTDSLSYDLLALASLLIRQGAAFVATNYDLTYPAELGQLPGAGAVLSVIASATGVQPTVVGKPYPAMFREAVRRLGSRPEETLMVGDRLETDIEGAAGPVSRPLSCSPGLEPRRHPWEHA